MGDCLESAPVAAAAFAIPQFLPQIIKLRRTDDPAGVSWPWAALTSVNNAAWFADFALSAYWAALVPSSTATLLAGALATMLALRGRTRARPAGMIVTWAALLAAAFAAPAAPAWERRPPMPRSGRSGSGSPRATLMTWPTAGRDALAG